MGSRVAQYWGEKVWSPRELCAIDDFNAEGFTGVWCAGEDNGLRDECVLGRSQEEDGRV